MSELIMPPDWVADGLCGQVDAELFHPARGDAEASRAAKRICNGDPRRGTAPCPVRAACLEWAMNTDQTWGIWGGLSRAERRDLRDGAAA